MKKPSVTRKQAIGIMQWISQEHNNSFRKKSFEKGVGFVVLSLAQSFGIPYRWDKNGNLEVISDKKAKERIRKIKNRMEMSNSI